MQIPHPLASFALARPDHPALIADDGTVLSARELANGAAKLAAKLARHDARAGDTLALIGPANAAWVTAFHAANWLGAAVLPLSPTAPATELRTVLRAVAPKFVLGIGENSRVHDAARAAGIDALSLAALDAETGADPLPERFWPLDETRVRIFTSGSTGDAKAVSITAGQLVFGAFGSAIRLGHDRADRWLCCLPLNHVGGLSILFRAAWLGISVVLHENFEASRVAKTLDAGAVSLVSLVPTMLDRVLASRAHVPFPSALRAILLGGAPADDGLLARCREISAPVAPTWGMTETASQIATRAPGDLAADSGAGAPLAFARVMADADGRLAVRGPIAPDGEFVTADCGFVDGLGRVQISGRADDGLISGGENIFPAEIEAVLRTHPAIADVAVVGMPSAQWGERPVAVLVASKNFESGRELPSQADLRAWCKSRMAAFKVPETYLWRTSLPRNAMGKLLRNDLRRDVAASIGEQAEPAQPIAQHIGDGALRE